MVDFPTGVSATDPNFLLGANNTVPAKAAITAAGLSFIAAADAAAELALLVGTQAANLVYAGPIDPTASAASPTWRLIRPFDLMTGSLGIHLREDFTGSTSAGNTNIGSASAGTGSGAGLDNTLATGNHQGLFKINTGTTTTGAGVVRHGVSALLTGGGEIVFDQLVYLGGPVSDGTDTYIVRAGLGTSTAADSTDNTNGLYFEHDIAQDTTKWVAVSAKSSTRTRTVGTGGTAAITFAAWTHLRIIANAAGTSVVYQVNGTTIATITTNIPAAASEVFGFNVKIFKSAGTSDRACTVDLFEYGSVFTTPRW